jgi:predicted GIY-YIG superfamily endonuclease
MAPFEAQGEPPQGVGGQDPKMHFVCLIRSTSRANKTYVGMTEDVECRLSAHNEGHCPSTSRFRPWELITYIAVRSEDQARKLEGYLKRDQGMRSHTSTFGYNLESIESRIPIPLF